MKGSANMPRIAPNPSIWRLVKGSLCARVTIFALTGTLLFAANAHAAGRR